MLTNLILLVAYSYAALNLLLVTALGTATMCDAFTRAWRTRFKKRKTPPTTGVRGGLKVS